MKKIIAFMLCFMFSFGVISSVTVKKEVNAFASGLVLYAGFKLGVSFTAFATYAGWFYANGYHIPINTLAANFANDYYDLSNSNYILKADKMNIIDKLNLGLSSYLSGNSVMSLSDIDEIMKDVVLNYPQYIDADTIIPDVIYNYTLPDPGSSTPFVKVDLNNMWQIQEKYANKIIKLMRNSEYYVYVDTTVRGYDKWGTRLSPIISVITSDGFTHPFHVNNYYIKTTEPNDSLENFYVGLSAHATAVVYNGIEAFRYDSLGVKPDYTTYQNSYAQGRTTSIEAYPNYYGALNGKAGTVEELQNLMNVDEQLQLQILTEIEKQEVNIQNDLVIPSIGADGMLQYGELPVDVTYTPTDTWYNNLYGAIVGMPDVFMQGITDLIDGVVMPSINAITGVLNPVLDYVRDIYTWLTQGLLGILQSILNAIISVFDAIVGLPIALIELLKDALLWLFVPSSDFLTVPIDTFKSNFSFIGTFTSLASGFESFNGSSATPYVSVDLSKFQGDFNGQAISMGTQAMILDLRFYEPYKKIGDVLFTTFIYLMFIWRFFGRLPEIINGAGMLQSTNAKISREVTK